MAHILVVEDDIHISKFVIQGLEEAGNTVEHADNAMDAMGKMGTATLDLVILDIMLKGNISGIDIISQWRGEGNQIPIIILSARDRVEDKVLGFKAGADDYLTKPFSFIELKARVENLLKRTGQKSESSSYSYEDLTLNLLTREVERCGDKIRLHRREFMLLEYFMENKEQVLGKTMILERIWGYDFDPQTNVVDVLISRLRGKIDKNYSNPLIHTIRGMGYVLKSEA